MSEIIVLGEGGPNDQRSLRLQTRESWDIPNFQAKMSSQYMRQQHAQIERDHPRWRLRLSVSALVDGGGGGEIDGFPVSHSQAL